MSSSARILMCPPDFFEVSYVINPWMENQVSQASAHVAHTQWKALRNILAEHAHIDQIAPAEGLPDMVFTANAGVVLGNVFVPSRFRHAERQGEEALFAKWFAEHGYEVREIDPEIAFEGAGDALLDRGQPRLWMGYGHRSDEASVKAVGNLLNIETVGLKLADPRFYHLDTCFCPLANGHIMYVPSAFDEASRQRIRDLARPGSLIEVEPHDAERFACNAVSIGEVVVLNAASEELQSALENAGLSVKTTPMDEFMKSGGAAKCLTLRLDEPVVAPRP
ncbi:arginine deiminase-related protein [Oleiagrimonas sp. C23AA]|uniref:dimethylarginine dimethylaminohydrolase family protein n=1 Tax=Oleiagrimonas sp. C23AA TaxID=2719047 RepID=UPI001423A723|nr:arginine deiminase-related protein [Oleiagrimonas sp. C23AA]NII09285.1 nitrate reductase [Oleiagrimonas sp. C23AA]